MIEVLDAGPWTRGAMNPSALDRRYFEAAAQGHLIVQRCEGCDHRQFPPKMLCTNCGAEPAWIETEGAGQINTFTIVRRHGVEPFAGMVPFVLAMIDLPEGVRLMGNVTDVHPESVHVGQHVVAYALRIDAQMALPLWRAQAS
jgi:uncharacterized OB-fold protein